MSNDTKTVLLSGVGGQGAILAADILSRVAMACGQDVKLSEIHGMAQRGGAVTTVVRLGDSVASMVADKGSVDYLVSFEKVEASSSSRCLSLRVLCRLRAALPNRSSRRAPCWCRLRLWRKKPVA